MRERAILTTSIERHALAAWPGLDQRFINGWVLTFGGGYTKRANSATFVEASDRSPIDSIGAIEKAYSSQAMPPVFRINPLATDLQVDDCLESLSYSRLDETVVQSLAIDPERDFAADDVSVLLGADQAWRSGLAAAQSLSQGQAIVAGQFLDRIVGRLVAAQATERGVPVAWGMGVIADRIIGLFNIVTLPEHRGRGVGGRLVRALLAAGARKGAEIAYLQVGTENHSARSLYAGLGFRDLYRYHYRRAP
jgi:ribosomal protein S18 acetylase RimI-like enzyme